MFQNKKRDSKIERECKTRWTSTTHRKGSEIEGGERVSVKSKGSVPVIGKKRVYKETSSSGTLRSRFTTHTRVPIRSFWGGYGLGLRLRLGLGFQFRLAGGGVWLELRLGLGLGCFVLSCLVLRLSMICLVLSHLSSNSRPYMPI